MLYLVIIYLFGDLFMYSLLDLSLVLYLFVVYEATTHIKAQLTSNHASISTKFHKLCCFSLTLHASFT